MQVEELVLKLLRERLDEALAAEFALVRQEIAVRVRAGVREMAESARGFSDEQVCRKLNISRSTLWHIRDDARGPHLLVSGFVHPSARTRLTTAKQLRDYLALVEAHAETLRREREAFDDKLDAQLKRQGGGVRRNAA